MAEERFISTDAATWGLLCCVNILADVIVAADPRFRGVIATKLEQMRAQLRANPETAEAATVLDMMLRSLTESQRALQRDPPQGTA